jgi:hypothetical protein
MAQSRLGVIQNMGVQALPLTMVISRFIQPSMPLSPLKPMACASKIGVTPRRDYAISFKGGKGCIS